MIRTQVTSPPAGYFVTLAEAKEHLRIESSYTGEDAYVQTLIAAATDWIEGYTHRKLATQSVRLYLPDFPVCEIMLPFGKIQSVELISYADTESTRATLRGPSSSTPGTDYQEALESDCLGYIAPAYNSSWPSVVSTINPVYIEYDVGFGDPSASPAGTCPPQIVSAIKVLIADLYERRSSDDVRQNFSNTATQAVERLCSSYMLPVWN